MTPCQYFGALACIRLVLPLGLLPLLRPSFTYYAFCHCSLSCQVTNRQSQEEQATAGRSRRGHKSAAEQSGLVRDSNVEVISMMLQALEKEHRWLLSSLQGPIIAFILDMLPVSSLRVRVD